MNELYDTFCTALCELARGTYKGEDLTKRFADDIGKYHENPWAWIKDRIQKQDFSGLFIGDYIPFSTSAGETFEAQIAGIDCYYNTSDSEPGAGHHIDFITRDCMKDTVVWNTENRNNGSSASPSPWLSSHLYSYLNTEVWETLPKALRDAVSPKRMMLEKRFSEDGPLSSSDGWMWAEAGNLWVPNEYEVYGSVCWGTKGFSSPQGLQYPLFRNSWKNRMKGAGAGGDRTYWWLLNPFDGDAERVCLVAVHGNTSRNMPTNSKVRTPICFRIGA